MGDDKQMAKQNQEKGLHTTTSDVELARRVRAEQGRYESEVTFRGEADLHRHWTDCDKNPGHYSFIPISYFKMEHLPAPYRHPDLYRLILVHAKLTVMVMAASTSRERPQTLPGTNSPYPFSNVQESGFVRVGTAWVWELNKKSAGREAGGTCPCPMCKMSKSPSRQWAQIWLRTAGHVVFDTHEAQQTICLLFYDNDGNTGEIKRLYGLKVTDRNLEQDWCDFVCVTHDLHLYEALRNVARECFDLRERITRRYSREGKDSGLAVIVSHPHGCNKCVSLGEWRSRDHVAKFSSRYTYTASTCPGSSGALVFIPERKGWGLSTGHAHSCCCEQEGLSMSGGGMERVGGGVEVVVVLMELVGKI